MRTKYQQYSNSNINLLSSYFKTRSDTVPKGRIDLKDATLGQVREKGELCIGLHFQGRVYVLQCKDKASKALWTARIASAIDEAKARARSSMRQ